MRNWVKSAIDEHRHLEVLLDRLENAIKDGNCEAEFSAARSALAAHYRQEDSHWKSAGVHKPASQHAEVLELADGVEEALAMGHSRDALATVRRFLALASHNLIEEERDWFPLL